MLKIAIVEDNLTAIEQMQLFLDKYSNQHGEHFDIAVFNDAVSFLDRYKPIYDLVFMDIELPFINGMDAAKRLRALDSDIILIFVTNMAQFAVKGYEVNAMDYIVKPVRYDDFERKLQRVLTQKRNSSECITIMRKNEVKRILLCEVIYIEVRGHKLIFHTESGLLEGSGTLQKIEEELRPKGFLRCNKCYLVNTRHIASVQGLTLVMNSGDELQIGRPRKKAFMCDLTETIGNGNIL